MDEMINNKGSIVSCSSYSHEVQIRVSENKGNESNLIIDNLIKSYNILSRGELNCTRLIGNVASVLYRIHNANNDSTTTDAEFVDLTTLLKKIEAEDIAELRTVSSHNINRVSLIAKTTSVLNRINNVNSERNRAINEINEELKVTKKRETDATNKSINNMLKLKEEVIADLEDHIFIFESK